MSPRILARSNDSGGSLMGEPWCPAEQPCPGTPCDAAAWAMCGYGGSCSTADYQPVQVAACNGGTWSVTPVWCNNPPAPASDAGPDVHDSGLDGEGPDGGHVADATAAPDAESE